MSDADAFFTHTIVGAPMSVLLGRQMHPANHQANEGLQIDPASGDDALSPGWRSWIITTQAHAPVGIPRMRPTRTRHWLERYALVIAATGVLGWLITAVYWSLTLWR